MIREEIEEEYSAAAQNWVKKRVDHIWPKSVPDKGRAFAIAWSQYKKKHGGKK